MASYTYPVPRLSGTLTPEQTHLLLRNPLLIAKRVAALTDQRFISDYLLGGRFNAVGGGIFYETGEQIFPADSSESVAPNGEYPKTVMTDGEIASAKTDKRGLETDITDERIARGAQGAVDRALTKLVNGVIRDVDGIGMAVIASKVTDTFASGAWTTVANVVQALATAKAQREDLALGLSLDTIALSGTQWAKVMGLFATAGVLPRENGNPIVNGQFPTDLLGYTWVTSPHIVGSDPLLVDREQLGGMADEDLGSPDYVRAGDFNVETYSKRNDTDSWTVRARRVVVPVVIEPRAGLRISGTTL
ncbi:hypothetical protein E3T26_14405 [Cryobacterium sp. TMT1-21]|uniref:phage major capsid protein n=1 Tax=Cryobacterium sp. TMT1-21 TaxID=1259234 RepID=UPI001068E689|nr:hypothetical protein [Cryobacterium sp. TMT1-21]TFD09816.1 hypothetical protein E3T26_14405 [Cryobacterium sp. TMT1-21]